MANARSIKDWEIKYVDLHLRRPKIVRVMLAQPHSVLNDYVRRDDLYFLSDLNKAKDSLERTLAKAREYTCDLVMLPELSVPLECVEIAREWSKNNAAILIAGSHYLKRTHGYVARCPIVVAGTVYFTEKITPAPIEVSPLAYAGKGLSPGKEITVFRNSPIGNFATLICSDYLSHTVVDKLNMEELDLLCVPAFQRSSDEYHPRMSISCDEHQSGIYILYGNNMCENSADGRSAIFALMDNMFFESFRTAGLSDGNPPRKIVELNANHSHVIADLDFQTKKAFVKRNVNTRPNVEIVSLEERPDLITERFAKAIGREEDRYARITDFYVAPLEYDAVLRTLEEKHIVFITGDPGLGKTYTAVRLLRHYFENQYSPLWFSGIEREDRLHQRRMLEDFSPEPKQVAYFEDPFGRTNVEKRDTVHKAFGPLIDRLKDIDARLIVTSRAEIFEQFASQRFSTPPLKKFAQELTVIKPSYSTSALRQILEKLASGSSWYGDEASRKLVEQEISKGKLATPLAVRDFVFSTWHTSDIAILMDRLEGRRREEKLLFVEDVISCDAATKLALALVFLAGHQPLSTLNRWFNELAKDDSNGAESLSVVLRRQGGYRFETYGIQASVWRFAHPYYEEAFASAAESDVQITETLKRVIEVIARASPSEAANSVARLSKKYPALGPAMVRCTAVFLKNNANAIHLCHLGLQCLALHLHFKERGYLDILREVFPMEELFNLVNADADLNVISHALKLALHYSRVLAGANTTKEQYKKSVSSLLQWQHLYVLWDNVPNWKSALDSFEWAVQIDREKVLQFLKQINKRELFTKLLPLTPSERKRFFDIVPSTAVLNSTLEKLRIADTVAGRLSRNAEIFIKAGIIINSGAFQALQNKRNLLPVGISGVVGTFECNDIVSIFLNNSEQAVATGKTAYSSDEVHLILGLHSFRIEYKLGYSRGRSVIREGTVQLAVHQAKKRKKQRDDIQ